MNGDSEKPHVVDSAQPAAEIRDAHQFSLRGLLWFAVLCSLWCSQIPILKSAEQTNRGLEFPQSAAVLASIFLAWSVLPIFCLRRRFYVIFLCHILAPLLGTFLILLRDLGTGGLWQGFVSSVLVVNLVCFPGAVVAMGWRWLDTPVEYARPRIDRKK